MKPRLLAGALFAGLLALGVFAGDAGATGPGGWDHLGFGSSSSTPSLNAAVYALNADRAGSLYIGGPFTAAGGVDGADRIARWDGTSWSAVTPPEMAISNGAVNAIAYDGITGTLIIGGTFINAGGDENDDFLAGWNGTSWTPVCNAAGPPITATVNALKIIGRTLYVAGAFADGAGIESADRLVACNLDTGVASPTVIDEAHEFSGTVYALAADSAGRLYAGGGFTDFNKDPAADNIAYLDESGWHALGSGGGPCGCAVDSCVRSMTAVGTDVYVGTDSTDVAGIAQADHVARWDGSAWSATGSNTAGTDGWFPASAFIYAMTHSGSTVYATGSFQNANGDPTADTIAAFGSAWHPLGSDGAGNGPLNANGLALAPFGSKLIAGGNFISAGGDPLAKFVAAYPGTYRLTVSRAGTGTGAVSVNGAVCSSSCSYNYAPGTVVNFSALTGVESEFRDWQGACSGTGACQVTMNGNKIVQAVFAGVPACSSIGGYTATGGEPKRLQLECRDTEGNPITYGIFSAPSHGTLGPVAADGGATYTADVGYSGPDEFRYNGTSPDGVAPTAFVSITVTDPGYSHAGAKIQLLPGKLTPTADGQLSLKAHNSNTFAETAISLEVTSVPLGGGKRLLRAKSIKFLKSTQSVKLKPGKTATLKGRLSPRGLALIKKLGHSRVQIRLNLKGPKGSHSSALGEGTLHAPR